MISLSNFEVNLWTNVAPDVLFNSSNSPKSFEKIKITEANSCQKSQIICK